MVIGLMPVFNEEDTVIDVLNTLEQHVGYVVIVNDGSCDKTGALLSDWLKGRTNAACISFIKNKGMSYALRRGFDFIIKGYEQGVFREADAVVTIDADGQHDPRTIAGMYEYFIGHGLDVLIGSRDMSAYSPFRILGNRLLSLVATRLGRFKFRDIECGFRVIHIRFLKPLLTYYIGIRYSCAGEIGLAASLLGYKIDNAYAIEVGRRRRRGPTVIDAVINVVCSLLIVLRVRSGKGERPVLLSPV